MQGLSRTKVILNIFKFSSDLQGLKFVIMGLRGGHTLHRYKLKSHTDLTKSAFHQGSPAKMFNSGQRQQKPVTRHCDATQQQVRLTFLLPEGHIVRLSAND